MSYLGWKVGYKEFPVSPEETEFRRYTEYAVEYYDSSGRKLEDTIEATSLSDLARKLVNRGIRDVALVFTQSEIYKAQSRARTVKEHINRITW